MTNYEKTEEPITGLVLKRVTSNAIPLTEEKCKALRTGLENLCEEYGFKNQTAFLVAYCDHEVLFGYWKDNKLLLPPGKSMEPEYLLRIRLFNETRELLIWRNGESFRGRLRVDGEGSENDVVDARQVLWGTDSKDHDEKFDRLFEKRGTELILPREWLMGKKIDEGRNRLCLKTRSYIGYTQNNLATYEDCRFMGIEPFFNE